MIKVRIPPSPTGLLHIGTVRTALYNYLFAKNTGGTMVFRIEDTDKERSKPEFEKDIIDGLVKLGIAGDEGVHTEISNDQIPNSKQAPNSNTQNPKVQYRQSQRTARYQEVLQKLLDKDKAYYCFCSKERLDEMRADQQAKKLPPRYDGACSKIDPVEAKKKVEAGEKAVIRLRVPEDRGEIKWNDLVRGEVVIHAKELDDFVIARSINDPLYHLTVVADDHDMEITHVIRGEDHISNTPKQILLFEAFGWKVPEFAHLPLILNEDKTKLSKRKNKVSMDDFLKDGYLPEALLNFLALLGWNTPDEQEIFTMDEMIEKFSLDKVHKGGAVFDVKKLDWINGEWIKKLIEKDVDDFYQTYSSFMPTGEELMIKKMLQDPDFSGRFKKLSEIKEGLSPVLDPLPDYSKDLLLLEKFQITPDMLKAVFGEAKNVLENLEWEKGDSSKTEEISNKLIEIVGRLELKNGQVLWPIRVALSGLEKSPNFATLAVYLGKEESVRRIGVALQKIIE